MLVPRLNFPTETNQKVFIQYLKHKGITNFQEMGGTDLWVSRAVLVDNIEVKEYVLSLGAAIEDFNGYD